jgi:hypothetical protein
MQNFDHNIGFWEKNANFLPKIGKIAENCDHNVDPSSLIRFENIFTTYKTL